MILTFSLLSPRCGTTLGYFLPYSIYLIILLFGTVLFNKNKSNETQYLSNNKVVYYILAFIPAVATFYVAFLPTLPNLKLSELLMILVYSLANGLLEELFWRGTMNKNFGNDIKQAYIIPTIIFTCWHFALLFAKGVTYHGGALSLVGGACVMGAIWGFVMFKTKNIRIVVLAHVLVNFFAFSQLIYENWLIK